VSAELDMMPFKLGSIVERLRQRCALGSGGGSGFRQFGGAFELADGEAKNVLLTPSCFVLFGDELARALADSQVLETTVRSEFGVVIVAKNYALGPVSAVEAIDALGPLRNLLRKNLSGWLPPGCSRVITFAGGKLLKNQPEHLMLVESFQTEYQFEQLLNF
jgi:hypothetical protein